MTVPASADRPAVPSAPAEPDLPKFGRHMGAWHPPAPPAVMPRATMATQMDNEPLAPLELPPSTLTKWAGGFTVAWAAGALILLANKWNAEKPLELNALGDYAAGVAAPLAFLWLVMGFWQQGREMRLSTEALRLQARELNASVEAQRELVRVTRLQVDFEIDKLKHEREEKDRLSKTNITVRATRQLVGIGKQQIRFVFLNTSETVTDIVAHLEIDETKELLGNAPSLPKGVPITMDRGAKLFEEAELQLSYVDWTQRLRSALFDVFYNGPSEGFRVIRKPSYDDD